jgi:ribosomal protein S18 acetylase RimI-like enzyme
MIDYRYLQPEDAEAAADIHIEGQPGTVLTRLGREFLIELYRAISCSEWGEGFGAYDGGNLVAHAAVLVSSSRFFSEFKLRHLWRVAWPVSRSVLRNPRILVDVVNGWSYPEQTRSPEREADVLFLGVKRAYLRQGLGPELVRCMFGWGHANGLTSANLMIEKRNRAMRWMIGELHGLYIAHEFEAYGRSMIFYKVPVADNLADARLPSGRPYTPAHTYSQNGQG